MITTDQLILSFRKIKWRTITFRKSTNKEDKESKRLIDNIPIASNLLLDHFFHTQCSREH